MVERVRYKFLYISLPLSANQQREKHLNSAYFGEQLN